MRLLRNNSQGSIIIFSLLILSLMIVLTQQLLKSVYVSTSFIRTMVDRERAEMVALGGVNTAIEILKLQVNKSDDSEKDNKKSKEKNEDDSGVKPFLKRVLPNLNRWQTFALDEDKDGVSGELKVCICCESGKININNIFDFEKEEFKKEYEQMLSSLEIRGKLASGELLSRLQEFFKKRKKPIVDVSELYEIDGVNTLDIFYVPPVLPGNEKEKSQPNTHLALQDIFTIWTDDTFLEPLMLSDSLCAMLCLRRPQADDSEKLKDRFQQVVESFDDKWGSNWNDNWRFLQVLYDEKPKVVQDLGAIFSKQFGPTVYSVLSSGKVGDVEQRLLAIVRMIDTSNIKRRGAKEKDNEKQSPQKSTPDQKKDASQQEKYMFKIVRAYWI